MEIILATKPGSKHWERISRWSKNQENGFIFYRVTVSTGPHQIEICADIRQDATNMPGRMTESGL